MATVDWFCAQFFTYVFNLWGLDFILNFADEVSLGEIFIVFVVILALHAMINIFSSHLVALFNNISVFWHCVGVVVIIGVLIIVPDNHQSADFVFTERINNSGFDMGMYWFYILPTGLLLTHVHGHRLRRLGARRRGDPRRPVISAAKGSTVGRAVGADRMVRAAGDHVRGVRRGCRQRRRRHVARDLPERDERGLGRARDPDLGDRAVLLRHGLRHELLAHVLRVLCATAPPPATGSGPASTDSVAPVAAVLGSCLLAGILTLPALSGNAAGVPVAFFAVVSIGVIGLYIAYVMPVFLRWRKGDAFQQGAWNLGNKWRWLNPIAVAWVTITSIYFCLPFYGPAAAWWTTPSTGTRPTSRRWCWASCSSPITLARCSA